MALPPETEIRESYRSPIDLPGMVEPTGTYVPANIARMGHHDRQARPPRQGSSFGRGNKREWIYDVKHPDLLIMGDRGRVVSIFSFNTGLFSNSWLPVFTEYHSHSEDIQRAVKTTATSISDLNQRVMENQLIPARFTALINSRKLIPSGSEDNEE
ncbi:unnamed protein product [Schistosoma margrebowiei]|uniref:Uncharacterized protein n=1 Tax=Schistosoma margrebowiei TaxID=48269 RepID=A0A183M9P6_9TREM|nr:unnamed protein product [Schistosoma margrebowiei]